MRPVKAQGGVHVNFVQIACQHSERKHTNWHNLELVALCFCCLVILLNDFNEEVFETTSGVDIDLVGTCCIRGRHD